MSHIDLLIDVGRLDRKSPDTEVIHAAIEARQTAHQLIAEERYIDALERVVAAMRELRAYSDYENVEFKALFAALLFDLAEVHYLLKDYKQSEKELDTLFKVLENLLREDAERFGPYHILAMELSTRILRSRKKAMDLLIKQRIAADALYEKVNSGVVAATDRLVDSLQKVGELLGAAGDYREALKFFAEAIKYSKKRTGKVTRKEIKMTIQMAETMMRVKSMKPRAKRLLQAVLPHAISLETIELEEEIIALLEIIDGETGQESRWKTFLHNIVRPVKEKIKEKKEKKG
ncbi:MAG: hypothetical protein K2H86_02490 [Muribaculaceae bacterium]|nr:hypothetical protein [Muribaculaceae bacterium]